MLGGFVPPQVSLSPWIALLIEQNTLFGAMVCFLNTELGIFLDSYDGWSGRKLHAFAWP